jgi:hypothetical protein
MDAAAKNKTLFFHTVRCSSSMVLRRPLDPNSADAMVTKRWRRFAFFSCCWPPGPTAALLFIVELQHFQLWVPRYSCAQEISKKARPFTNTNNNDLAAQSCSATHLTTLRAEAGLETGQAKILG